MRSRSSIRWVENSPAISHKERDKLYMLGMLSNECFSVQGFMCKTKLDDVDYA